MTAAEESGTSRVFRVGGDEFVVLAPVGVADRIIDRIEVLWQQCLNLAEPIIDEGHTYSREHLHPMGLGITAVTAGTLDGCETSLIRKKHIRKRINDATSVPSPT